MSWQASHLEHVTLTGRQTRDRSTDGGGGDVGGNCGENMQTSAHNLQLLHVVVCKNSVNEEGGD